MNTKQLKYFVLASMVVFTACDPEIEDNIPSPAEGQGNADFSTYVALGNSLTAGYADGALYQEAQINSYPAIIAEKMAFVSPGLEFNQPLIPAGGGLGFIGAQPVGRIELKGFNPSTGLPIVAPAEASPNALNPLTGTFQNLGVPGAKVGDLNLPGYGSPMGNPYFARFASAPTVTVAEMAAEQNPTFFTLWIGNNDVLGYATQGGEGQITSAEEFEAEYRELVSSLTDANSQIEGAIANIPNVADIPFLNTVPWNSFSLSEDQAAQLNAGLQMSIEPEVEKQVITTAVSATAVATQAVYTQAYQQAKAQGVTDEEADAAANAFVSSEEGQVQIAGLRDQILANLENDNLEEPLATLVASTNALISAPKENRPPEVQGQIDFLIANPSARPEELTANITANITGLKAAKFYPVVSAGANGFIVEDNNSPTGIRQLTESEKVTLTFLTDGIDQLLPTLPQPIVPDKYALDAIELDSISNAVDAYNNIIGSIAEENTFALVDMNNFFEQVVSPGGVTEDGTTFTNAFIEGNAFSLDGVHLTQKGYALVAKRFIEKINSYYNAKLPLPNLDRYPTVVFPSNNQ